jgi:dTDP-glucose 4,6-dehydratase
MRALVTGLSGFIGHHLGEYLLAHTDWEIVGLDRYGHAGAMARLMATDAWDAGKERVRFVWHDLRSPLNPFVPRSIGKVDFIFHLAASTHVDRSIEDPLAFVMDNTVGTCNLLNYARQLDSLHRFFYFSTDEVFGPAGEGQAFGEWDRYRSSNPYAASKAGAEELSLAFCNTYRLPIVVTHTMNVFGERQHPEKFIPLVIRRCLSGEKVLVHADAARTRAGSRYYIHAKNVAAALCFLCHDGKVGEKYNIVGEVEVDNLQLARLIERFVRDREPAAHLDAELVDFHSSRPGHDLRYALDGSRLARMGFAYPSTFEESLGQVVRWSLNHPDWLLL